MWQVKSEFHVFRFKFIQGANSGKCFFNFQKVQNYLQYIAYMLRI